MNLELALHIAYAAIFIGVAFCFILHSRQKRQVRLAATRFALAFLDISNTIIPTPPQDAPRFGKVRGEPVLSPKAMQPISVRNAMERVDSPRVEAAFKELSGAWEATELACGRNKRLREQFAIPLYDLFLTAHAFLLGSENPAALNGQEHMERFDSFLREQVSHRRALRQRIAGDASAEFDSRNAEYPLF